MDENEMQTSSLQVVLESPYNEDHADGNAECRGPYASREGFSDDSKFTCSSISFFSRDSLAGCIPGDWSCPCP
jgi:hypothetical protein